MAADAAPYASAPDPGRLSPTDLAQAQAGTLRGYRDDAARLSIHYNLHDRGDRTEQRRWMALAAATGSNLAIQNDVDLLRLSGAPADCAEARALIAKAKIQYAHEIATARGQDGRQEKLDALEALRLREGQMNDGACGTTGG